MSKWRELSADYVAQPSCSFSEIILLFLLTTSFVTCLEMANAIEIVRVPS